MSSDCPSHETVPSRPSSPAGRCFSLPDGDRRPLCERWSCRVIVHAHTRRWVYAYCGHADEGAATLHVSQDLLVQTTSSAGGGGGGGGKACSRRAMRRHTDRTAPVDSLAHLAKRYPADECLPNLVGSLCTHPHRSLMISPSVIQPFTQVHVNPLGVTRVIRRDSRSLCPPPIFSIYPRDPYPDDLLHSHARVATLPHLPIMTHSRRAKEVC